MPIDDEYRKVAYAEREVDRAVQRQAQRLDELRARSSALLAAASISAAFLGAVALDGGEGLTVWTWVAVVAFALVVLASAFVLVPLSGWRFTREARKLLRDYADDERVSEVDMLRRLAEHREDDYARNEARLRWLYGTMGGAALLLGVQVLALIVDLATRR